MTDMSNQTIHIEVNEETIQIYIYRRIFKKNTRRNTTKKETNRKKIPKGRPSTNKPPKEKQPRGRPRIYEVGTIFKPKDLD